MTPGLEINLAVLYASCVVGGVLLVVYAISMIVSPPPHRSGRRALMLLLFVAALFVVLILFSMPIVFALGVAGVAGLFVGGYDLQVLSSSMVSGSQSWVLLAIPAFVFAGGLMEKCGMSHALVDFARALVGWVKGGLGMSVIVVAYFFSDICGSKMAEVSALGSTLMPPLTKAGYKREDSASLIAAGTAMGMLVPPAIFMIVIAQVTNTSAVALFLARLRSGGHHHGLPDGAGVFPRPQIRLAGRQQAQRRDDLQDRQERRGAAGHPDRDPGRLLPRRLHRDRGRRGGGGLRLPGRQALLPQRHLARDGRLAYDSAILTAAVVFLLAVASVFQYLMGVSGVPALLADVLEPLEATHWLFLLATALITMMFGMVLEGLPAAVVLIPVVFPIAEKMGIDPIHFNIVQTAAVGIGLFLPPMGVGLLMALRFANLTVGQHWRAYMPYHRRAAGRAAADHPVPRPLAVPAEERRPHQVTLVTVSRWCLPSRAVQEIDWPVPSPISAAPTGVITEMRCSSRLSSTGQTSFRVRVWPSSDVKVTVEPMRTTSSGTLPRRRPWHAPSRRAVPARHRASAPSKRWRDRSNVHSQHC